MPVGAATLGAGFKGEMDEVQVTGVARGMEWMAVQAALGPESRAGHSGVKRESAGKVLKRIPSGHHPQIAYGRRMGCDRVPRGHADRNMGHVQQGGLYQQG